MADRFNAPRAAPARRGHAPRGRREGEGCCPAHLPPPTGLGRRSEPETTRPELETNPRAARRLRNAASPRRQPRAAAAARRCRDGHSAAGCRHRDSGRRQPRFAPRARQTRVRCALACLCFLRDSTATSAAAGGELVRRRCDA